MAENKNDPRNQNTDNRSHQEQTQDGKKKEEINPNNPVANQNKQQNPNHNGQHEKSAGTMKNETDVEVEDEDAKSVKNDSTDHKKDQQMPKMNK